MPNSGKPISDPNRRAGMHEVLDIDLLPAGIALAVFLAGRHAPVMAFPSALAQPALEFPAVARAGDGDDVEIQALRRIAFRYERDFAEKSTGGVVVTPGSQDLQALVVQRAAGGLFTFVGGLNDRDIGY